MKIAYTGLELPQGKTKYDDRLFVGLVEKFRPAKVSPYYFEFLPDDFTSADVIAISEDQVLDLVIPDMERMEGRLSTVEEEAERKVLTRCLEQLERQKPICDLALDDSEQAIVNALDLLSSAPTLIYEDIAPDANVVCRDGMEKAGMMFFYTVGKKEVHAWLVAAGSTAVTCAGKIHSDLARGFIKAEVVSCDDMMTAHNMQDARSRDLTTLVDADHVIPMNSILDIRFNV